MNVKTILAVTVGAVALLVGVPASAQGIPVIDPGNIAQTVKVVQNGVQQVQQLKAQAEQMTSMAKTIGQNGPMAMAKDMLTKAGMNYASPENSPLKQYRAAMPGLLDALPGSNVGQAVGVSSSMAQNAKVDINAGRQFALNAFYKPGVTSQDEIDRRRGVRQAAMRDSVTAGYAMSVYTKNDLGKTETTMKVLSEGVTSAPDLRGDVQSNSAIALAQLQQLTVQSQLLSQLLEVQSTSAMAAEGSRVQ